MTSVKMDDVDSLLAIEEALARVGIGEDEASDSEEESSERRPEQNSATDGVSELTPFENRVSQISDERASSISQEAPNNVNLDLHTLLEDDRTFLMFRRFLRDCCITRNLQFWLACEHYRQLPSDKPEALHEVAKAIYVKFLKSSAPQYVSITDQTRRNIKICLELRGRPLTSHLFSKAQAEIWGIMEKNEMRQFLLSDVFADCSSFTHIDAANAVYTPSMAKPVYGVCGGGSLQHSGSEDSASVSSFSTEDGGGGPRSTVLGQVAKNPPFPRRAHSDTEGSRMHPRAPHKKAPGVKDKSSTREPEELFAMVRERLLAVHKDREMMTQKVRDRARKQGKQFEEIMDLEWYDLPETCKYLRFDGPAPPTTAEQQSTTSSQNTTHLRPPSSHSIQHIHSPYQREHSSTSTPRSTRSDHSRKFSHVQSLAAREVQDALKDMEIANEVNKKRLTSGSSSVHTTSDSGVGVDMWAGGGNFVTSDDRTRAYLYKQSMITNAMPERDRDARAAAIALISNSPQVETLNPRIPSHQPERSRRQQQIQSNQQYVRNFSGAFSDSDSSSCATMNTQSSLSELFIPRRPPPANSVYSDEGHRHHYPTPRNFHHRRLSSLKRSPQLNKHNPASPSPIAEHRPHIPHSQSRSRPAGETLVVYHFDEMPTPYAKRLGATVDITLGDFKDKVFQRRGDYRFFFKSFCDDLQMEIFEEYSDESAILPLVEGKIIGRVEKKV